jgi:hypothetical protein
MRRLVLSLLIVLSLCAAYYAGAQQLRPAPYPDLRAAWERVQGQTGQFTPYDEQLLAFKLREDGAMVVEAVGADYVVFRVKGGSLVRIVPLSQVSLNFDQP